MTPYGSKIANVELSNAVPCPFLGCLKTARVIELCATLEIMACTTTVPFPAHPVVKIAERCFRIEYSLCRCWPSYEIIFWNKRVYSGERNVAGAGL